ncbi:MAG: hypothetical protein ACI9TY_000683 [Alphaproteobacteria bacterium]|jgi:hypothetical protein
MYLFEKIKLPKALAKATGSKMKFAIGEVGDFEQTYNQKIALLDEMPSVNECATEELDPNRPRIM